MARKWTAATDESFARQNEAAVREAREAERIEPRADFVSYDAGRGLVLVEMTSGFVFGFAPERAPGLAGASAEQLSAVRISPSGDGLHWDDLDAHVSLGGLITEAFQTPLSHVNLLSQARGTPNMALAGARTDSHRCRGTRHWPPRRA